MADSQRKSYNLFDVEFEQGSLNTGASAGTTLVNMYTPSDIRIRAKTLLKVEGLETITISFNTAKYELLLAGFTNENYYDRKSTNWLSASTIYPLSGFDSNYIDIIVRRIDQSEISPDINDLNLMLNTGSTPKPYEPYGWVHSLRKMSTATEAVETPLYSDGTAITAYTIKGNTVQSGTPTPSSPIAINGVGNKTANLLDYTQIRSYGTYTTVLPITNGVNITGAYMATIDMSLTVNQDYYMSWTEQVISGTPWTGWRLKYTDNTYSGHANNGESITPQKTVSQVLLYVTRTTDTASVDFTNIMLSTSNIPYEPYGQYKIPISSGQTALNPMYLTEQLMKIGDYADSLISSGTATYNIKKYELTGQEDIRSVTQITGGYRFLIRNNWGLLNTSTLISSHFLLNASWAEINCIAISSNLTDMYFILPAEMNVTTINEFAQWLADQSTAGTPVTLWYVLATATTEQFTAPSIPTTEGANSITVDTTVQPSDFTATWTGWHDSSVKEYDGTDWQ